MNCTYRSIWNEKSGTFVAVSENATSAGKKTSSCTRAQGGREAFGLKVLAISLMLSFGANVYALPAGGVVAAGGASINSAAGNTTVTQSTQNAAINWQSFNIGQTESVRFVQPNSNSVILNRVLGSDPSSILGNLTANGKVFLVNPNGVLFGKGASVNVGGLVASTLNISDTDVMAGNYKFSGNSGAALLNQGSINADGGYVALLGANVSNEGVIAAKLGTVALAAGQAVTLDLAGDGLLNVTVNQGAINALVNNGGLIRADGGHVLLTSRSASSLLPSAVNNTGVIRAQTLVTGQDGSIMLMGDMQSGTVNVGGTLDASAPHGGDGGFIETSAAHVKIAGGTVIRTQSAQGNAGTWLIDPVDFTIASIGGDITPADLATALAGNVTILSANGTVGGTLGNVNVNNDVTWNTATTLTLNAVNDVNFNAAVTATNGGSLVAIAGNDIVVAANTVTGITTTGGNIIWTAGRDIQVNSNLPGQTGVTATFAAGDSGNITWRAGRDVNINSQVTATGSAPGLLDGNFTVCCGRDIKVNAATTTTDGDTILKAGRDIVVNAAMTTTRGNVILRAGSEASAAVPGLIGGTVVFTTATPYTVNGPVPLEVTVDYTPASYATPTNYSTNFTGDGAAQLQSHMLVFAQGNNKVYDGNTNATLSFRGDPTAAGSKFVTLVKGAGTATFDDKNVANNIGITYDGYSLGGINAAEFALWGTCTDAYGAGRTSANITPLDVNISGTRVYDATKTASSAYLTTINGVLASEVGSITVAGTGEVTTKDVAVNKDVSTMGSLALVGTGAGNYKLVSGALTITPLDTNISGTRVYDASQTASSAYVNQISTVLAGDTVTVTGTGNVATKDVGVNKDIVDTGTLALAGTDASNYNLVNRTLTVTPAQLTVTANDVTKNLGETPILSGFTTTPLVNGETVGSVTETSPGQPATAPVGTGYPITPTNATGGTFTPSNYNIDYADGVLTVLPLPVVALPVVALPPVVVPPAPPPVFVPTENAGNAPEFSPLLPVVVNAETPPELLSVVTAPTPPVLRSIVPAPEILPPVIVVPTPAPTPPPPVLYVTPPRPPKQDRN